MCLFILYTHLAGILCLLCSSLLATCRAAMCLSEMQDCLQVSPGVTVDGTECDVSSSASVARLAAYAKSKLGCVDVWINNAGYSGSFQV